MPANYEMCAMQWNDESYTEACRSIAEFNQRIAEMETMKSRQWGRNFTLHIILGLDEFEISENL